MRLAIALTLLAVACSKSNNDNRAARTNDDVAKLAANRATLDDFRASVRTIINELPSGDALSKPTKCPDFPSGTKATTVDYDLLTLLVADPIPSASPEAVTHWSMLDASLWHDLLRETLSDSEPRTKPDVVSWKGQLHTLWKVPELTTWLAKQPVIVFHGEKVEPQLRGAEYSAGTFTGHIFVVDMATRTTRCHAPIASESAMMTTMGGSKGSLTDALVRNLMAAARRQLATIAPNVTLPSIKGE